jgi:hypothetical protein
MAISSVTDRLRALFGEVNTSSVDIATEVDRAFEKSFSINLSPGNAVTNTTKRHIWYAKRNMTVTGVKYVPDAAVALNATNYATLTVYTGTGAAAAATTVATANTSATNMVAGTPWALTITAANADIDADETLAVEILKAGAGGVAVAAGALVIHYIER